MSSEGRSMLSSRNPHFIKIIHDDTIREKMLCIPKKFMRKYGGSLSDTVQVKLPCGTKWVMELCYHQGNVWLKKGWSRFVDHYSISQSHVLTFRYKRDSQFRVVIFDTSNIEIDYPPFDYSDHRLDSQRRPVKEEPIETSSDSKTSLQPCSRPLKRPRTNHGDDPRSREGNSTKGVDVKSPETRKKRTQSPCSRPRNGARTSRSEEPNKAKVKIETVHRERAKSLNRNEVITALVKTRDFTSNHPLFRAVMQPSYIHSHTMRIEACFARKHLTCKSGEGTLKLLNETTIWAVKYDCRYINGTFVSRFLSGWKEFAEKNQLKIGDACVFVLLPSKKVSFEVVIFRDEDGNKPISFAANTQEEEPSALPIEKSLKR